jgi:hypothetical protein
VVLSNELACVEECAESANVGDGGDTCLFVTLMDQFGDGWVDGTNFSYWSEIRGEASNVVSMTLGCGCARMSGCIRPSELNINQLLHMTAVSVDESSGEVRVPAFFWEVYWTVQIVEQGVWKEKYYGGYNTSLSFEYSPSSQSFEAVSLGHVWKPEAAMSCDMSSVSDYSSFLASRVYVEDGSSKPFSHANETSSYVVGGGGGYHESVWVVTDTAVSVVCGVWCVVRPRMMGDGKTMWGWSVIVRVMLLVIGWSGQLLCSFLGWYFDSIDMTWLLIVLT